MIYMIVCIFLMLLVFMEMFLQIGKNSRPHWLLMTQFFLTLAVMAPILVALYTFDQPIRMDSLANLSIGAQWVGVGSAAMLFVLFCWRTWRAPRRFWYSGAVVGTALLTFIFADSLNFVSRSNAGFIATFAVDNGSSSNNDVKCTFPTLLIHYTKGAPSDWRCPTSIALLSETSTPFVPWPDYQSGHSKYLTSVLDTITGSSIELKKEE